MTWATDDIFVAGGDYVRDSWADFQAQTGVRAVITVGVAGPVAYLSPLPWAALWLPVADEAAYTLDQLGLGVAFIDAALAAGHKVLLHGLTGLHRTRPLVAAHLLAQGRSLARVKRDLETKPWLPPYKGSLALLEAWVRHLAGESADTGSGGAAAAPTMTLWEGDSRDSGALSDAPPSASDKPEDPTSP